MSAFKPTDEQVEALDAWRKHDGDQAITAYAGAGKTSTLKLLGATVPRAKGAVMVYNRSAADDMQGTFSPRVQVRTAHAFAFAAVGKHFSHRLQAPRPKGREVAKLLGLNDPIRVSPEKVLAPTQVARIVMLTVERFCLSDDRTIQFHHMPTDTPGTEYVEMRRALAPAVIPAAQKAWDADLSQMDGRLRFTHDCYLKLWSLSDPVMDVDFVMLDEAQDTNPVVAHVFDCQTHAHRVAVGDSNQSIYQWRGAIDYMAVMDAKYRHHLTQSFRFGDAIAAEANKWLRLLGNEKPLRGFGNDSRVATLTAPRAILCRTNATAMSMLIDEQKNGRKARLVGGGSEIRKFAEAADQLRDRGWCSHPELQGFETWGQVQDYVENDHGGDDFKVLVGLVEEYGSDGLIKAIDGSARQGTEEVTISTAHKAKGGQWESVRIAPDFPEPSKTPDGSLGFPSKPDLMLAYVAVTRAQKVLDDEGLSWVDRYLGIPVRQRVNRWADAAAPAPATPTVVVTDITEQVRAETLAIEAAPVSPTKPKIDLDDLPDVPLRDLIGTSIRETNDDEERMRSQDREDFG